MSKTFAWVQSNIRYVAVEKGDNAWKPDAPQEVIRKRYGDCKGMAMLLRTLLRHQGIDARLADVSSSKALTPPSKVASLNSVDHMVCVAYVGGKEFWLDATNKYVPLGFAPDWTSGSEAIVEDGNKCKLVYMPTHLPQTSCDSVSAIYRFDAEANALVGKLSRSFSGDVKNLVLNNYFDTESQDRKLYSAKLLGINNNYNIDADNIEWADANSQSQYATLSADISNKSAIEMLDNEVYIELCPVKDALLPIIDTDKRKSNYELPMLASSSVVVALTLPKNMKVESVPDKYIINNDNVQMSITYTVNGQTIFMRKEVVINNRLIPLNKIADWNATIKRWNEACNEQIVLKKK